MIYTETKTVVITYDDSGRVTKEVTTTVQTSKKEVTD